MWRCLGAYSWVHLLSLTALRLEYNLSHEILRKASKQAGILQKMHNCSLLCESFASGKTNLPPLVVFFILPSFCFTPLPAYPCLPRSVRRLCWSACWKSCGSWLWTPWKRPSFCRRSQIKRWEHKHTHTPLKMCKLLMLSYSLEVGGVYWCACCISREWSRKYVKVVAKSFMFYFDNECSSKVDSWMNLCVAQVHTLTAESGSRRWEFKK